MKGQVDDICTVNAGFVAELSPFHVLFKEAILHMIGLGIGTVSVWLAFVWKWENNYTVQKPVLYTNSFPFWHPMASMGLLVHHFWPLDHPFPRVIQLQDPA